MPDVRHANHIRLLVNKTDSLIPGAQPEFREIAV